MKNRHSPQNKNACKRNVYRHLWRRWWDSNPRIGCPINAFRVRPVMTTSIRLRSRYIIATFKRVSKTDLALHDVCGFLALEVFNELKNKYMCSYDDSGSIGKRYVRNDIVGTPSCITIDYNTLEDDTVTVRDRDTTTQKRINYKLL